jgi:hypothetical protein
MYLHQPRTPPNAIPFRLAAHIRANCVAPGAVPEMDVWSSMREEALASLVDDLKKSLTGTVGRLEDIAER